MKLRLNVEMNENIHNIADVTGVSELLLCPIVFSRPYLRSRYWYSVASVVVVVVVVC